MNLEFKDNLDNEAEIVFFFRCTLKLGKQTLFQLIDVTSLKATQRIHIWFMWFWPPTLHLLQV
jgi:hypothetical protein